MQKPVYKRDKTDEANQNSSDGDCHFRSVNRASAGSFENIRIFARNMNFHNAFCLRLLSLGNHNFCDYNRGRCGDNRCRQKMSGVCTEICISNHKSAGDCGHSACHHRHNFRTRHGPDVRPDYKRGLGHSHKDIGRRGERLRAGCVHYVNHNPGH